MDRKVSIVIAGVNLELGAVSRLSIDLSASGDSARVSKGWFKGVREEQDNKLQNIVIHNAYPHPEMSVDALPQTFRGRDARSDVGVARASMPYERSMSPVFVLLDHVRVGSRPSSPSKFPLRTLILS